VDARREMAGKKQERLSKDTYMLAVNIKTKEIHTRFKSYTDEKVHIMEKYAEIN
jgi:hypothetical protein